MCKAEICRVREEQKMNTEKIPLIQVNRMKKYPTGQAVSEPRPPRVGPEV